MRIVLNERPVQSRKKKVYVYVTIFGALGAASRYGVSLLINSEAIPLCTLAVNILGCFLLSFIVNGLSRGKLISEDIITGLGTGFVGAFTTFSAFSVENVSMILDGKYIETVIYISLNLFLGIIAVVIGMNIGKHCFSKTKIERSKEAL